MLLYDAESLNLAHPLVRAAIDHARAWTGGGSVTLHLPKASSPELLAAAGKAGVIRVMMVDYAALSLFSGSSRRQWSTAHRSIHRSRHSLYV
jgi:hypothetical protein